MQIDEINMSQSVDFEINKAGNTSKDKEFGDSQSQPNPKKDEEEVLDVVTNASTPADGVLQLVVSDVNADGRNDNENLFAALVPLSEEENKPSKVYLVTYSKADKTRFVHKMNFATACETALGGGKVVSYYACSEELHSDGSPHYHCSIKLNKTKRWKAAKERLREMGAKGVQFSVIPDDKDGNKDGKYAWAYRYTCKSDPDVYHSATHPTLRVIAANKGKTSAASAAKATKRAIAVVDDRSKENANDRNVKKQKLDSHDVCTYIRDENIRTVDELLADAETRRLDGDDTLCRYVFSRNIKSLGEQIDLVWRMAGSVAKVKSLKTPRMEKLISASQESCATDCDELWLRTAVNLFEINGLNPMDFAIAVRALLEKGRGKHRNLFLLGPGNSGKTFLLKPLKKIYPETFANPASSTFSWIGADEASIILLNDYRWHTKMGGGNIDWGILLNLLEGFEANLPAPMNHYSKHVHIVSDVPIFGTGPDLIKWYAHHPDEIRTTVHQKEDNQMKLRWKTFTFTHIFTDVDEIKDIPVCGRCFAKLALLGYF